MYFYKKGRHTKKALLSLILLISFHNLFAQISISGTPESFLIRTKAAIATPQKILDAIDTAKYLAEDLKEGITNRYGVIQQVDINIKDKGVRTEITNKGYIWKFQVQSSSAHSLGIIFKRFLLPPGAKVFLYNQAHNQIVGAFTNLNNNFGNQLTIAEFKGQHVVIEYFEPFNSSFQGELVIGSVSQAYKDVLKATQARIGINCPEGVNWQAEKHAVCRMTFNDTRYSYFCTGFLINNVKADGTPYFQTANHCISTNAEASTLVTYFNYENTTCNSIDAQATQTLSGATLMANSSYTDFSLLLLNESPPVTYEPYFAGWDASGRSPQSGTSIHHPEGTPKSIALDYNAPTNYPYSTQWTDENNNVTSTTTPNTHWEVQFDAGTTEPGSSGSPLFDDKHRVIGQLHGGGGNAGDLYSKFSISWNYYNTSTKQLKYWLDPDNTGITVMNGIYFKIKPLTSFSTSFTNVCPGTPVKFIDQSKYAPTQWNWKVSPSSYQFVNGTGPNSQNPEISFNSIGVYSVSLSTANIFGSDSIIKTNYINAGNLKVKLSGLPLDSAICGCKLINYPFSASGAEKYLFKLERTDKINYNIKSDSVFLSLKPAEKKNGSFNSWLKVTGTQGSCYTMDSLNLKIVMPPNDDIENAIRLMPGRNSYGSNFCASVENNEPFPPTADCYSSQSWCPEPSRSGSILKNTIWFTFLGPSNGKVTIDTHGFNDRIAVYKSNSFIDILSGNAASYNLLAANDDRSSADITSLIENLAVEPYKMYWLQVDGYNSATGNVTIDLLSNSLEVFPNPSSGQFTIVIPNTEDGESQIEIFSSVGKIIYSSHVNVIKEFNRFSLDLSSYPSGMYILRVSINGFISKTKLIIAK